MQKLLAKCQGDTVYLSGSLDEKSDMHKIEGMIKDLISSNSEIKIDLGHLSRSNSVGIRGWLNLVSKLKPKGVYLNAPAWFLEQVSMIPLLCSSDLLIMSFQLPYYSEVLDQTVMRSFEFGKGFELREDYEGYESTFKDEKNTEFELDATPDVFEFILAFYEDYKKKLGK